ncbi:MAG: hypothetical protein FWG71_11245 [Synergistaceae bacterium]|nr:hypothetical protein [Synergistaceae bacterium]
MKALVKKVSVFLLLAAMFVFAGNAEAGVIMIHNATGFTLMEIYISDSGTDDWEEDILGHDVLEDGETLRLTVSGTYSRFDMAAVDDEGDAVGWYGLPGNVTRITIYGDGTAEYQ